MLINTRYFSVLSELGSLVARYNLTGDETRYFKDMNAKINMLSVLNCDEEIPSWFSGENIYLGKSFPSLRNINTIGNRLVLDIKNELNSIGKAKIALMIDSFLDTRNELAHESGKNLTYADVVRHHSSFGKFISASDRLF